MSTISWLLDVKPEPFDRPAVEIGVDKDTKSIVVCLHQNGGFRRFVVPAVISSAIALEVLKDGSGNG